MSKIKEAFKNKKAFIAFITAGDPSIDKTEEYILKMAEAGADLVEIGIPFSDPTAEGPVIQNANIRALKAGTTVDGIFAMVERIRKKTNIPLVFLTYLNPVFHYGYDRFFSRSEEVGIDGMIIPDLPFEEQKEAAVPAADHGVDMITLIAPTSKDRIQIAAKEARGFIYVVSSMGVTGIRSEITTDLPSIIRAIKDVTNTPCAVGFGINTPEQAAGICEYADGVIVGSAIVKIVAEYGDQAAPYVYDYVKKMKDATSK